MKPTEGDILQKMAPGSGAKRRTALKFVLMIGVVSFFADFTYEGSRSITGPFLQTLGATGAIVGIVAGLGELLGYGLRFVSGRISERTREFWPITFFGYIVQMAAVPMLAFARNWQMAALLILMERIGKAIRNPPRDVMLSHATKEMGFGWGFGIHEALDQSGALVGPLLVAFILAHRGYYKLAFGTLLVPAIMTVLLLSVARFLYPRPEDLETNAKSLQGARLPRSFWTYLIAAALVAAGFADFQLISFHFQQAAIVKTIWIPIFYSVAMAISGVGSLVFGRLFDRFGISVLIPLTVLSACCSVGFSRWVLDGAFRRCAVGAGNGSARIHHSSCRRDYRAGRSTAFCIWIIYRRVWHLMVSGKRDHGHFVRSFACRRDRFLRHR